MIIICIYDIVNVNKLQIWLSKWKIKSNEIKSANITFTLRKDNCPAVSLNNVNIPLVNDVKYLDMHLDRGFLQKENN